MQLPVDHAAAANRILLDFLNRWLSDPEAPMTRLFIPRMKGLMCPSPGMQLHEQPELVMMEAGMDRYVFPEQRHDLLPGHIALVPSGLPHVERFVKRKTRFLLLVVMFDVDRIRFRCADFSGYRSPGRLHEGIVETREATGIAATLEHLARLGQGPGAWQGRAVDGLARGVFAWLGAVLHGQSVTPPRYSPSVLNAINQVSLHLDDSELGAGRLAGRVGCSANYLSDCFHRETGSTLTGYIQHKRVQKAEYLLAHSALRMKEIAAICGFRSQNYFTRLFRQYNGIAPTGWRQRLRQAHIEDTLAEDRWR